MRDMLGLVDAEMRPIAVSFHENKRTCSPQRANGLPREAVQPPRANKRTVDQPPTAAPSTRLSGLMKRIQAKANDCQNQLESFVSNVSSAVHLGGHKKTPAVKNCQQGVVIGPVHSPTLPCHRPYVYQPHGKKAAQEAATDKPPSEATDKEKNAAKHTYVIKLATLTPATMHSAHRRMQQQQQQPEGPFKTWNAPQSNKTRPDLSLVGFRPDKHVTCIEVTLINNRTVPDSPTTSEPGSKSPPNSAGMKTYCFGELPESGSPIGTLSSRSSSRGSEQSDSGFEEMANRRPDPPIQTASSTSIIKSIFNKMGGHEPRAPKVQAKRSTIRREKAFRQRNKHAWSRAKEIQRNDELLQRFHQIRKRLGEEDEQEDGQGIQRLSPDSPSAIPCDLLGPLPSIVQTLVRQYDTGGQQRSRDKIVPSRLHSKRSSGPSKQTKTAAAATVSATTQVLFVFLRPVRAVHGHLLKKKSKNILPISSSGSETLTRTDTCCTKRCGIER